MTSDAKIGLLLGLVFIFIIAFIINGLPTFRSASPGNELTEHMRNSSGDSVAIGERMKNIQIPGGPRAAQGSVENMRYNEPPAGPVLPVRQYEPMGPEMPSDWRPIPQGPEPVPSVSVMPMRPKVHVVTDGETLSSIAKKHYGPVEGNKLAVIEMIFNANRNKLDSVHDIVVGQKLVIPPMSESDRMINVLGGDFTKVETMGGKPVVQTPSRTVVKSRVYTVKEDDSLWSIAERELGNGNRYVEISKLNSTVLENEDSLKIGMRLKLPSR